MKTLFKVLSNENPKFTIPVDSEDPIVKFSSGGSNTNGVKNEKPDTANIIFTVHRKRDIDIIKEVLVSNSRGFNMPAMPEINEPNAIEIDVELKNSTFEWFSMEMTAQVGNDLFDVSDPLEKFDLHIKAPLNSKIIFSAPFGQGKTTFLDYYFEKNEKRYDVFKVFPVNYSVATNEDIFRYIKVDILFQLMGKDIQFDKEEVSILTASQEYIFLNPIKSIASFIKAVMNLNSKAKDLFEIVEKLQPIFDGIKEYYKDQQIDDEGKAQKYIDEIYENEGSIFEDNFYTQLIRQLLQQLRERTKNESVLIIEDLDRMDPDHIFRILNVISAHYDTYQHHIGDGDSNNKFGFDKIIVVCDKNNIENIFHHKYGEKTHFEGYFNKFFSSKPFDFNNNEMVRVTVRKLLEVNINNPSSGSLLLEPYTIILESLIKGEQLSLRELLKLLRTDYRKFKFESSNVNTGNYYFYRGAFTKAIAFLTDMIGKSFIGKIEFLKLNNIGIERDYDQRSRLLIASLSRSEISTYTLNGIAYNLSITTDYNDMTILEEISYVNAATNVQFSKENFYDLLLENIKKYNQLS